MPSVYKKYSKIIQEEIDTKRLELALKYWESWNQEIRRNCSRFEIESWEELKGKIDDEINHEKALKFLAQAKMEYKRNNYNFALDLYEKAKSYMDKCTIMDKAYKDRKLKKIGIIIHRIHQRSNVQFTVDKLILEDDHEKVNEIVEELGKLTKENIELFGVAIDRLIEVVDSENENIKFKGLKGLGEISVQRPEWAYIAISKLIETVSTDEIDDARTMALIELSKVGQAEATMLIEHLAPIMNALRDSNQHVRRWASFTINVMAEGLPLEVKEAVPALREALDDEYYLVQQFANKALQLIGNAISKNKHNYKKK